MSNRRGFLKNALMSIAISLVPEILRPVEPEVVEGDMNMYYEFGEAYNVYDAPRLSGEINDEPPKWAKMYRFNSPYTEGMIFFDDRGRLIGHVKNNNQ